MTRIKLCGLKRDEDIEGANRLQVDYAGFVFAKKSKRYVTREQAACLKKRLAAGISAVGVFVNEDIESIISLFEAGIIDVVQLHGQETKEDIELLKKRIDAPVIQAFSIETLEDAAKANQSVADYVLLDAKTAGGGVPFDWSVLKEVKREYFLAGGLTEENVAKAVEHYQPFAVDVSSGIETDGKKDWKKMQKFVNEVRRSQDGK